MAPGHYTAPHCGGLFKGLGKGHKSGKGESRAAGSLGGGGGRMQMFPAANLEEGTHPGTYVYISSRWDEDSEIYDLYWIPTPNNRWWESKSSYDWVFIEEVAWDLRRGNFEWDYIAEPTCP